MPQIFASYHGLGDLNSPKAFTLNTDNTSEEVLLKVPTSVLQTEEKTNVFVFMWRFKVQSASSVEISIEGGFGGFPRGDEFERVTLPGEAAGMMTTHAKSTRFNGDFNNFNRVRFIRHQGGEVFISDLSVFYKRVD